jgi:hypothetical protein
MESFLSDNSSARLNARRKSGRWSKHNSSSYPDVPYWFNESTGDSIWTDPTAVAITVTDSSSRYRAFIEEKLKSNQLIRRSEMERINSSNLSKAEKDNIFKDCVLKAIKNENCLIKNISSIVQVMRMDIVLEAITIVILLEDFSLDSTLANRYIEVMLDSLEGYEASSVTSAERISRMLSNAIGVLCLKHLTIISTINEESNEAKPKGYSDDEFLTRLCMQSCDRDAKSIDRVYEIISKIFRRCHRVSSRTIHVTMKHRIHVLSFHPNLAFEFRMKLLKFNHTKSTLSSPSPSIISQPVSNISYISPDDWHVIPSKRNLKAASVVTNLFKTIMPSSKYSIVLLFGAPGIGKSHFGNRLVANQCADRYVDIGKMLKDYKVLKWYHRYQTESRRDEMCRIAKHLLSEAITDYLTTTDGRLPLVLTYVKEPSHAYQFIDMVEQLSSTHNITSSYHAWLLYDEVYLQKFQLQKYTNRFSVINSVAQKKFRKWLRHYSSIIEVLSGTNRLYKITSFSNNLKAPVITPFKLLEGNTIQQQKQQQYLVTREQIRCHVDQSIRSLLGISEIILFRSAGNKLTSEQHLQWVTSCHINGQRRQNDDDDDDDDDGHDGHQRYFISKSDEGRRFWLYIDGMHNMWFISLKGNLYSTEDLASVENLDSILQTLVISADHRSHTPFETVLDGVISTMSDNRRVFRAFDILAYNRQRTWIWKLSDRLKALQLCCEQFSVLYNTHSIQHCYVSAISIEINPSYPVDNDCVALIDQTTINSDAWVFTPELPYVFGPDPLMFEWRDPIAQIATLIHVPHNEVSSGDRQSWRQTVQKEKQHVISTKRKADQTAYRDMEYGLVYKCRWSEAGLCWIPVGCDLDAVGLANEDATAVFTASREEGADSRGGVAYQGTSIALEEVKMVKYLSRDILLQSLKNESTMETAALVVDVAPVVPVVVTVVHHPVKRMDFDTLFFQIALLVQSGVVEEFNDEQTGLRVYNTYTHKSSEDCDGSVVDESIMQVLDICRGLVLHPPSKTIVASPFVRFRRIDKHDIDSRTDRLMKLSCKYDGTLIIAFLWNNQVFTSTKRRMNSEQATLALNIIQASRSIREQLIEGWTYLFELIGDGNLHVCNYNVPLSLVLLTIINSDGVELSAGDKYGIAKDMDVLSSVAMYTHLNSVVLGGEIRCYSCSKC